MASSRRRLEIPMPYVLVTCSWAFFMQVAAEDVGFGSRGSVRKHNFRRYSESHNLGEDDLNDDDGYAAVAQAALQVPVEQDTFDPTSAEELRNRALRAIVAKRVASARTEHKMMKEFMTNFAKNLKIAVLEDSKGDIPENERLHDIAALTSNSPEPDLSRRSRQPARHRPWHSRRTEQGQSWLAPSRPTQRHKVRMLNAPPAAKTSASDQDMRTNIRGFSSVLNLGEWKTLTKNDSSQLVPTIALLAACAARLLL